MKDHRHMLTRYIMIWCWISSLFLLANGPVQGQTFIYTSEKDYLDQLKSLSYTSFKEGFEEDAAWGIARNPVSASSITSKGILWTSNHPRTNGISTSGGAAISGNWGAYDPVHGLATGSSQQCDVETPPSGCLFRDGLSGKVVEGREPLSGVGGWFSGMVGAKIVVVLNRTTEIELGKLRKNRVQFFGIIDTDGFTSFQLLEVEGKVGDKMLLFVDDLTFGQITP